MFQIVSNCCSSSRRSHCSQNSHKIRISVQYQFNFSFISVQFQLHFSLISTSFSSISASFQFNFNFILVQFQLHFSFISASFQFNFSFISVQFQFNFSPNKSRIVRKVESSNLMARGLASYVSMGLFSFDDIRKFKSLNINHNNTSLFLEIEIHL